LRVRMAAASGIADGVHLHKVTRRVEYNGTVMRRVQAVADAPEGGQVSSSTCWLWWLTLPEVARDPVSPACCRCGSVLCYTASATAF
jgi:hypothetical protein